MEELYLVTPALDEPPQGDPLARPLIPSRDVLRHFVRHFLQSPGVQGWEKGSLEGPRSDVEDEAPQRVDLILGEVGGDLVQGRIDHALDVPVEEFDRLGFGDAPRVVFIRKDEVAVPDRFISGAIVVDLRLVGLVRANPLHPRLAHAVRLLGRPAFRDLRGRRLGSATGQRRQCRRDPSSHSAPTHRPSPATCHHSTPSPDGCRPAPRAPSPGIAGSGRAGVRAPCKPPIACPSLLTRRPQMQEEEQSMRCAIVPAASEGRTCLEPGRLPGFPRRDRGLARSVGVIRPRRVLPDGHRARYLQRHTRPACRGRSPRTLSMS